MHNVNFPSALTWPFRITTDVSILTVSMRMILVCTLCAWHIAQCLWGDGESFGPGALWRGVVPTPQSPPSPECRDLLIFRAWEERLSPSGLYHCKTGSGAAVWTWHQSKRNGDIRDLGTLFWQSRASSRPKCLEILFSQPFLFLGFLKIAALQMVLCTREQPMALHAFPVWRVRRLAAHFHLLPFRLAASLGLPGRK